MRPIRTWIGTGITSPGLDISPARDNANLSRDSGTDGRTATGAEMPSLMLAASGAGEGGGGCCNLESDGSARKKRITFGRATFSFNFSRESCCPFLIFRDSDGTNSTTEGGFETGGEGIEPNDRLILDSGVIRDSTFETVEPPSQRDGADGLAIL
jgi:hypothetical protein